MNRLHQPERLRFTAGNGRVLNGGCRELGLVAGEDIPGEFLDRRRLRLAGRREGGIDFGDQLGIDAREFGFGGQAGVDQAVTVGGKRRIGPLGGQFAGVGVGHLVAEVVAINR